MHAGLDFRPPDLRIIAGITIAGALLIAPFSGAFAKEREYGLRIGFRGGPPLVDITIVCGNCHYSQRLESFETDDEALRHKKDIYPKFEYDLPQGHRIAFDDGSFLTRDASERNRIVLFNADGKKRLVFPVDAMLLRNASGKPSVMFVPH